MNMKWLKDGPGFSPDGGRFWKRGDKIFWEDGEITSATSEGVFRCMKIKGRDCEDFSQRSEEKRKAVQAEYAKRRHEADTDDT